LFGHKCFWGSFLAPFFSRLKNHPNRGQLVSKAPYSHPTEVEGNVGLQIATDKKGSSWSTYCKPFQAIMLRITMYTQVCEEESSPLLCGFTAMLFGSMPLAYEDSEG
jgi:hypothetical protein